MCGVGQMKYTAYSFIPCCTNVIESLTKTKSAVALLKKLNAYDDVQKCQDSKKIRAGKGKMRKLVNMIKIQ